MKKSLVIPAIVILMMGFALGLSLEKDLTKTTHSTPVKINTVTAPVKAAPPTSYDIWTLTNQERINAGLNALALNPVLDKAAETKCNDMVTRNYWSHIDPDGNHAWGLISQYYGGYEAAAENLSAGQPDSTSVVAAWLASPEHKANMLTPSFTDTGIAVCHSNSFVGVNGQSAYITVQHFANR